MLKIFLAAITGFSLTFLATPYVLKFAKKYGLVDNPEKRAHPAHTHKGIVPRAGGLAIYLGFLITSFLFLPVNKILWGILAGSTILVLIGLWDDKVDLSPYFRFFTNLLVAGIVVGMGVGVPYINNPLGGIIRLDTLRISFNFLGDHSILVFADLFAILWIVACMNMVNWSKGVDGQMPGFVAIAAFILGVLSLRFSNHDISQESVTILAFITSFCFLGFLPWNFYPQKIMPGYSGGTLAGFLLAVLSILSWGKLGTFVLVLGMPLIDAGYTVLRRLVLKKSPFKGDAGHLHHKLLTLGWGRRRIAVFYWLVSAILGITAISLNGPQKLLAFLFLLVILGSILLYLSYISTIPKK